MVAVPNNLNALHNGLPLKVARGTLLSAALVVVVSLFLIYVYVTWLSPNYDYMGFPLHEGGRQVLWCSFILVALSAVVLPVNMHRFSDYFLWMVFYFLYLPSMLYVPLQGLAEDGGRWLVASLALSFAAMTSLARYRVKVPSIRCSTRLFFYGFFAGYVLLNLYVLYVYGGTISFVQFSDVYDQRQLSEEVTGGSLAGYAAGFLSGAFNPFLMAVGLTERRKGLFVIGFLGQMLMYSTAALKFVLLSAVLIPIFYFFHVKRHVITSARLGLLVFCSCLIPLAFIPLLGDVQEGGIGWQLASIVFMRTYGMAGALPGVYSQFFANHPHTYYSHINLIGLLVPYPYAQSVGQEVGFDMSGVAVNANASFWATDGIAAAGNVGVVLIGVFVGLFLAVCNGLVKPAVTRLAYLASIPFVMMIANSSLFTALLTGGGGLLFMMIYLWPGTHAGPLPRQQHKFQ